MIKFLNNELNDINDVIKLVSKKRNLPEIIIEKDLWVSYTLDYLFNRCKYKNFFEFKGGTSLSKGYNLIDRFSEDVDIIINTKAFSDIEINSIYNLESKNKKQNMAKKLNKLAIDFYNNELIPTIEKDINNELNKIIKVYLDEKDMSIYISYPSLYEDTYINNSVKLEIGPLAAWSPNEKVEIKSFIQELYPNLFNSDKFTVLITKPKRTFWEKAMILHQEANRTDGRFPTRYSRHYYDLYKMYFTEIKDEALKDTQLLDEVRLFNLTFYPKTWSNYENAKPRTFKLYPNEKYINELEDDYNNMKKMIFSKNIPEFSEILSIIKKLENEINSLP